MHRGVILTSPSDARHAVRRENRARLEAVVLAAAAPGTEAMGQPRGKCTRQNVPHVAKTPKCLLNRAPVGRSTVQIVTAKRIHQKDISYQAMTMIGEGSPTG
jgi:hypothetical protein